MLSADVRAEWAQFVSFSRGFWPGGFITKCGRRAHSYVNELGPGHVCRAVAVLWCTRLLCCMAVSFSLTCFWLIGWLFCCTQIFKHLPLNSFAVIWGFLNQVIFLSFRVRGSFCDGLHLACSLWGLWKLELQSFPVWLSGRAGIAEVQVPSISHELTQPSLWQSATLSTW